MRLGPKKTQASPFMAARTAPDIRRCAARSRRRRRRWSAPRRGATRLRAARSARPQADVARDVCAHRRHHDSLPLSRPGTRPRRSYTRPTRRRRRRPLPIAETLAHQAPHTDAETDPKKLKRWRVAPGCAGRGRRVTTLVERVRRTVGRRRRTEPPATRPRPTTVRDRSSRLGVVPGPKVISPRSSPSRRLRGERRTLRADGDGRVHARRAKPRGGGRRCDDEAVARGLPRSAPPVTYTPRVATRGRPTQRRRVDAGPPPPAGMRYCVREAPVGGRRARRRPAAARPLPNMPAWQRRAAEPRRGRVRRRVAGASSSAARGRGGRRAAVVVVPRRGFGRARRRRGTRRRARPSRRPVARHDAAASSGAARRVRGLVDST